MIRAIAIDDEPKALEVIRNHAQRVPSLQLEATFTDPFAALAYLNEQQVDLLFLDIQMPDLTGLEFTKAIRKKELFVVFTTAYPEYAPESYEVEALDYLLKPFDFPRFLTAVHKAKERAQKPSPPERDFFFVNAGNQQCKICFNDIRFVEGNGNYITYFTREGKVMVRSTIKETLAFLPSSLFVQIQRSYIISLKHIHKIQENHVYIDGHSLSIGAKYRERFKSIIEKLSR